MLNSLDLDLELKPVEIDCHVPEQTWSETKLRIQEQILSEIEDSQRYDKEKHTILFCGLVGFKILKTMQYFQLSEEDSYKGKFADRYPVYCVETLKSNAVILAHPHDMQKGGFGNPFRVTTYSYAWFKMNTRPEWES